jgi:hypothetical protein
LEFKTLNILKSKPDSRDEDEDVDEDEGEDEDEDEDDSNEFLALKFFNSLFGCLAILALWPPKVASADLI